jgi:hypothetical protein
MVHRGAGQALFLVGVLLLLGLAVALTRPRKAREPVAGPPRAAATPTGLPPPPNFRRRDTLDTSGFTLVIS